jgi:NAD(P)-dependent dehydrogenase (short-subunit alcohol dehydrogenase family)
MSERFTGRTAMVTGAGSGIGLGVARALLTQGATVLLCLREGQQGDATEGLPRDERQRATLVVCDVREGKGLAQAVHRFCDRHGKLHHLVCAAGVQIPGAVGDAPEQQWTEVLDVNLGGVFRTCAAAIPAMRGAQSPSIVLVTSVQASLAKRNGAAYIASKGGIAALARAMALDCAADGIRVNVVAPGVVDTPMLREAAARMPGVPVEDTVRAWAASQPLGPALGEPCLPEDVANAVLFLLSGESRYITGSELRIDGGLAARLAL